MNRAFKWFVSLGAGFKAATAPRERPEGRPARITTREDRVRIPGEAAPSPASVEPDESFVYDLQSDLDHGRD